VSFISTTAASSACLSRFILSSPNKTSMRLLIHFLKLIVVPLLCATSYQK
jgi:hypothetical protein